MATYCIGDLHGRSDLFEMLLDKIEFNPKEDTIYILGDVIDHNYGAISILKRIGDSNGAITLLKGNHESNFLFWKKRSIDFFMNDEKIKPRILTLLNNVVEPVREIESQVINTLRKMPKKKKDSFREELLNKKNIMKWVEKSKQRTVFLDTLITIAEENNYDIELLEEIFSLMLSSISQFKSKPFLKELFELDNEEYLKICAVIENAIDIVELEVNDRKFILQHIVGVSSLQTPLPIHWNTDIRDVYYIFGHEPVAAIHKKISNVFDFNFREILSYKDCLNRYYFNLDMSSNAAAALRLDDLEEFYVMKYKRVQRNNIYPPEETAKERKHGYKRIYDYNDQYVLVTYNNHCIEYIIMVNTELKTIEIATMDSIVKNLVLEVGLEEVILSEENIVELVENEMNEMSIATEGLLRDYITDDNFFLRFKIERYIENWHNKGKLEKRDEIIDDEIIRAVISLIKTGELTVENQSTKNKFNFETIESFTNFLYQEVFSLDKELTFKFGEECERPKLCIS